MVQLTGILIAMAEGDLADVSALECPLQAIAPTLWHCANRLHRVLGCTPASKALCNTSLHFLPIFETRRGVER
ncbi:hypothetical protein, partial [Azospirillum aestuarii]|uniref:hypothetical protein n=1 Tax=Azospirillum aestuarii TaxID=2802052 RepID=UPI001B3B677B